MKELLDIQCRDSRISRDMLRGYPLSSVFQADPPLLAQPGNMLHRFALVPEDLSEIEEVSREGASVAASPEGAWVSVGVSDADVERSNNHVNFCFARELAITRSGDALLM
jgi:hypothetical protein